MSCWISVFAGNDSRRLQNIYKWKCYGIIYGRNCSLNFRRKKWCRIRQNCSQLNTVISVIEAMYLCEGMWLFPFCAEDRFFNQPSCIYARAKPRRAKYTHRTKLRFVLCVFRPCRGQIYAGVNYKCYRIYAYAGYGRWFVNGCLSIHSR